MIAQTMENMASPGYRRRLCHVLLPLFALFLGACAQVTPGPTANQDGAQTTSSPLTPEQQAAEKAATEKWAAEKRAAEQRAAALWAADQKRAEKRTAAKRAAEKRAAEKRAAEKRAAEKRAAEKRAAEKRAEAEKREAESLEAELAEARRAEAEFAAIAKAETKRAEAERAEAEKAEAERAEAERAEAERAEAERAEAERAEAERAEAAKIDEQKEPTAEPARTTAARDWSEVKYPWEEGAEPLTPTPTVETAKAEVAAEQRGMDKPEEAGEVEPPTAASRAAEQRDWSEVKYPWEEGAEPVLPSVEAAKAEPEVEKRVADKPEGPSEAELSGPAASRDWSQVKYPWEGAGTSAPVTLTMMEAANKEGEIKRLRRKGSQKALPVELTRVSIGPSQLELVRLPGGRFLMGSEGGENDERPIHEVVLRPFQIGRYEVTQRQWQSVMGSNPSYFSDCADCPVDNVSWNDIQQFLDRLNQRTGKQFRLPTEAEWEYACRAGGEEAYCGGGDEIRVAWFFQNSEGRSQPVGQLAPNRFGISDMSGNVYEWVADCWHGGYAEAPTDGRAWVSGDCQRRVLRGGAWYYAPGYALATYRNANTPQSRFIIYGFRLAHDD